MSIYSTSGLSENFLSVICAHWRNMGTHRWFMNNSTKRAAQSIDLGSRLMPWRLA